MKQAMRRARYLVVGLTVALSVLVAVPLAMAHNQSGDHVGCVSASSGHWKQFSSGTVTYAIEGGGSDSAWEAAGTSAWINIPGFWGGGWWSIGGVHPQSGTAYMHCH